MAFVDNCPCPGYMYMYISSSFFNYKVLPIRKLISIDICSKKKKEFFSAVSIVYSRPLGPFKTLGVPFVIINMLQT